MANYAERRLALSTQETLSIDLELRVIPRLGDLPLTQFRPSVVERFAADLEREGTGRATIASTLAVLPGVMKRAVRDLNLPSNPVKQMDKPSQREPLLVSVEQVEMPTRREACARSAGRSGTMPIPAGATEARFSVAVAPVRSSASRRCSADSGVSRSSDSPPSAQ